MRSLRHLSIVSAAVMIALGAPSRPRAAAGDVLPFKATERTLANGLKVIVVPTGFPNLVSIVIAVQVGARNDVEPGKSGFAHLVEHLMFRGTPTVPPETFRSFLSRAGARDNANTDDDRTHYYATFGKEHRERVLSLYADMFQHLSYSEADFKTEALAVLGEYNKSSADPAEKLAEVQRNQFYRVHTYQHGPMGLIRDIENMPNEYEYSKRFFTRWYRPQYTSVVVAGDVTAEDILPIVEKYWGSWKSEIAAPVEIPREPSPRGPRYAHVPWSSSTLPYMSVAFPSPPFDETRQDIAAMDLISYLYFGATSALYKRLVVSEQKVDWFDAQVLFRVDPTLYTVRARVKNPADTVYVRDQILATFAAARTSMVPAQLLADTASRDRYIVTRSLDSTERIASVVGRYTVFRRSYDSANNYRRTIDALTPADVQATARKYFTDAGMVVTTLSKEPLPAGIDRLPSLDSLTPVVTFGAAAVRTEAAPLPRAASLAGPPLPRLIVQKSIVPQLDIKLLFTIGSAHDPPGKEGLAALTGAMIAKAGSRTMTIDEIAAVLYPIAGSLTAQVDKEMTTFTGAVHRDHASTFLATVLPQLLDPGFRDEDFRRMKAAQLAALVQDLRSNNEEELGKERLQTNVFRGTPYGHVVLGTVAGLNAIALDDVKQFAGMMYTRANLSIGISGDASGEMVGRLQTHMAALPAGPAAPRVEVVGVRRSGTEVEILEKDTRATAISFGFPIAVTRAHPDFAALSVARVWLGEHRISSGRLFQQIREVRGINYGDYAYIEAFPRGMSQFFPDPNLARQHQIFEIWIRPVVPVNAHMSLRLAINELDTLIREGLTKVDFDTARDYLMSNVYVMTARQDERLGYALDSQWYGIGEFTSYLRNALRKLTRDDVNAAVRRHLDTRNLFIVCITRDAAGLKQALASDARSPIRYDGEKAAGVLAADMVIGALKLGIAADRITVTPIEQVFAK